MKRVIVDYSKLTNEILNLLVDKFPDGYDDSDIVRFKNAKNETIEAVEVRTIDTIFLVKISTKLSDRIVNYDEDEEIANVEDDSIDALKELEIDENEDDDDENDDSDKEDSDSDDEDDEKEDFADDEAEDDDED